LVYISNVKGRFGLVEENTMLVEEGASFQYKGLGTDTSA
jgi:hypothetical protein